MEENKVVPYMTRTGLQIGRLYVPEKKLEYSYDMELLQEAILMNGSMLRREKLWNIAYAVAIGLILFLCVVIK